MTVEISSPSAGSIRGLLGELAQLEDAARAVQARARQGFAARTGPVLDPELVSLFKRQAEVVAALRRTAGELSHSVRV